MTGLIDRLYSSGVSSTGQAPAPKLFAGLLKSLYQDTVPFQAPQEIKPIPRDVARLGAEYLRMATGAYRVDAGLFPGWRRIQTDSFQGLPLHDPDSGFDAEIYVNDITGEHTIAFRGTDFALNGADLRTDSYFATVPDSQPVQFRQAMALGEAAKAEFGDNLTFTGSSLGSALAATAGLATGTRTITGAPVGLSEGMIDMLGGLDKAKANAHLVTNFALDGDLSDPSRQHNRGILPYRFGETYYLRGDKTGLPDNFLPGPLGDLAYRGESVVWLHELLNWNVNELDRIGYGKPGNETGIPAVANWLSGYLGSSTFRNFQPVDGGAFQTTNDGSRLPPGVTAPVPRANAADHEDWPAVPTEPTPAASSPRTLPPQVPGATGSAAASHP